MKAIETEWNGVRYRSRLEARWAVFLSSLRVPYEYEKEGFELPAGRYLPDFWLPNQQAWMEIKGEEPSKREMVLAEQLSYHTKKYVMVFHGGIFVPGTNPELIAPPAHAIWCSGDAFADADYPYHWCACSDCGAVGMRFEGHGPRIACAECGASPLRGQRGFTPDTPALKRAYRAAAGARFEHGEKPALVTV